MRQGKTLRLQNLQTGRLPKTQKKEHRMNDAGNFQNQNDADRSESMTEKAGEWTAPHRTPIGIQQTQANPGTGSDAGSATS